MKDTLKTQEEQTLKKRSFMIYRISNAILIMLLPASLVSLALTTKYRSFLGMVISALSPYIVGFIIMFCLIIYERNEDKYADAEVKDVYGDKKMLSSNKTDVNAKGKGDHTLISAAYSGDKDAVASLLSYGGANVDARDKLGNTALMIAAEKGHQSICQSLIAHGSNVNAKNKKGDTALLYAAQEGYTGITELLLEHESDVNAKNKKGDTALLVATSANRVGVVRALLNHTEEINEKIDVNATNNEGRTALMLAVEEGHAIIVRLLLKDGRVNIDIANKKGETALVIANKLASNRSYQKEILDLLSDYLQSYELRQNEANYLREKADNPYSNAAGASTSISEHSISSPLMQKSKNTL